MSDLHSFLALPQPVSQRLDRGSRLAPENTTHCFVLLDLLCGLTFAFSEQDLNEAASFVFSRMG